jgi:hypothetical protein
MAESHAGPTLVGDVLVVPAELLAEVLAELEAPRARVPLGVAAPRRSSRMVGLVDVVRRGALEHRQRERLRRSQPARCAVVAEAPGRPALSLLGRHQGDVVGVEEAARMLAVSEQRTRVLAAGGAFPGAQKHRCNGGNGRRTAAIRWCIPVASVHAHRRPERKAAA